MSGRPSFPTPGLDSQGFLWVQGSTGQAALGKRWETLALPTILESLQVVFCHSPCKTPQGDGHQVTPLPLSWPAHLALPSPHPLSLLWEVLDDSASYPQDSCLTWGLLEVLHTSLTRQGALPCCLGDGLPG